MKRLLTILAFALAFFLALLIGHHNATAANLPNSVYDQIATEVAGQPYQVTAWCEDSPADWYYMASGAAVEPWGFTYPPGWSSFRPVVYLAPLPCAGLGLLASGQAATDVYTAAAGLEVLLHESIHQRGGMFVSRLDGESSNEYEGRTECTALALMPTYLARFGIQAQTVTSVASVQTVPVQHERPIYRKGRIWRYQHWTTYVTQTVYTDQVTPNPVYQAILDIAQVQHADRASVYPTYGGGC